MNSSMQVFEDNRFGVVRTIDEDGKVLFCGRDVASALGYAKPQNALSAHCRYALKRGVPHPQAPGKQMQMLFITEGDVYRLIVHSRLPAAEDFERWVFDDVLPAIRRTGSYGCAPSLDGALATLIEPLERRIAHLEALLMETPSPPLLPLPAAQGSLSPKAQALYHSLCGLQVGGKVQIDGERLAVILGVKSRKTARAARDELIQSGLLRMIPGTKGCPSTYVISKQ